MRKKLIIICAFAFLLCLVSATLFIGSKNDCFALAEEKTAPQNDQTGSFASLSGESSGQANYEKLTDNANENAIENADVSEENDSVNNIETAKADTNIDQSENKITAYIKEELTPLLTGLMTAVVSILALLVPYIKTLGKLKKTQGAYANMYEENEKLYKIAENVNFNSESEKITQKVIEEVSEKFKSYDNALANLIKETELTSAQISTLIEGAKIAWKEAEGASVALCKVPSATLLSKQALTIDFLKTYVAEKLGVMREELDKKIDEDLNNDKLS